MSYRFYAESIEVYNDHNGEWSEQWLVSDWEKFGWVFEVKCKNKDHAQQVAKVFNSLIPAYQGFTQEAAQKAANDLWEASAEAALELWRSSL